MTTQLTLANADPSWMAFDWIAQKLYVLDIVYGVVWVFDTAQPTGALPVAVFDLHSILPGGLLPKIEVDSNFNIVWLSDGKQTIYALNGFNGAINPYVLAEVGAASIVDFADNYLFAKLYVSDSSGSINVYNSFDRSFSGTSTGVFVTKLNSTSSPASELISGFTPTGTWASYPPPAGPLSATPFTIESSPVKFSAAALDFSDGLLTSVNDPGTGGDRISVWSSFNGSPPWSEMYAMAWPGTGFAGHLIILFDGNEKVLGLDTTGALYTMTSAQPLFTYPFFSPDWQPTLETTFPEPCLQILPYGVFQNGANRIWALGPSGTIYGYNTSSALTDLQYSTGGNGSLLADSSFSADLSVHVHISTNSGRPVGLVFMSNTVYVLDAEKKVWIYNTLAPSGSTTSTFYDISAVTLGIPKISDDTSNFTMWFSDGLQTLYKLDLSGAVTPYDITPSITGNIVSFEADSGINNVYVADSGGNVSRFDPLDGSFIATDTTGAVTTGLNSNWSADMVGFTPTGLSLFAGVPIGAPSFMIEVPPVTPISATFSDEGDAIITLVLDLNGTGNYQLSVWDNNTYVEHYTYTWPGVNFAGGLRSATFSEFTFDEFTFGLDATGVLYQMTGGPPNSIYNPPQWQPTVATVFPEPCLDIQPDGVFQSSNSGRIWAVGASNRVYGYNANTGAIDRIYTATTGTIADSSILADVTVQNLTIQIDASLHGSSSISKKDLETLVRMPVPNHVPPGGLPLRVTVPAPFVAHSTIKKR